MSKICGVYTIINKVDNKVYVGYSVNIQSRKSGHFKSLEKGTHGNNHLQKAVIKYGLDNFKFELIVECLPEHLCSEENFWCNMLDAHNPEKGYNIQSTGDSKKIKFAVETRQKLSQANKGHISPRKGIKLSDEEKRKMSERMKGHIPTNLAQLREINKNRKYLSGYKLSEEHKGKIAVSSLGKNTGKKRSAEQIKRISDSHKGIKQSLETCQKRSKKLKGKKLNQTQEGIRNKSLKRGGAILQYDLNMNLIKEWECSYDIRIGNKDFYKNIVNIGNCCRGKRNKACNYIWKYKISKY